MQKLIRKLQHEIEATLDQPQLYRQFKEEVEKNNES